MIRDKYPIHTTLSTSAMRILERYEKELGAKNLVLEQALLGMDKLRFREKIDPQSVSRIIKRTRTGIRGFDELIEGGIPEGFVVVVTGPPGTGKTTFSIQFLLEGVKNNERCIYFSFEEKVEQIIKQSLRFGWDAGEYIDKGYLEIFGFTMLSSEEIIEIFNVFKPRRVVFDSLNIFFDEKEFRKSAQWRNILKEIRDKKITCLVITEKKHGLDVREFDDFDFMGDGTIFLDKKLMKELYPTYFFQIQKMRLTKINEIQQPFEFSDHGIELVGARNLERRIAVFATSKKVQEEIPTKVNPDDPVRPV
ncbi:MAG: AAA family ATPase [Candidatus Methanoperedens sp.]|nr:AAA family ATPase [Candidatus Methanoperedens sp.]MCE8424322.1 AAA family ATPase [Candidatus Methanoperedens sp.]MCE8427655.1 AAA family ATPase [Candidatus Methanoperedens sp.]